MRKLIASIILVCAAFAAIAQSRPAYAIFTCEGKETDYGKMLKALYDADIIFIESVGEYIRLHLTSGQRMMTLLRLKNMESALPADRFMRVHRSYIVNLSHVAGYARGEVFLDSGDRVPLSVNYRDAFREYIDRKHPSQR